MSNTEIKLGRLLFTIKRKNNDEAYKILEKFGINAVYKNLGSALSIACMSENWEIAEYCIAQGAEVNCRDVENSTPLIDACKYGNLSVVKQLIEAGAEVNVQNKYDKSPIAKAISAHPSKRNLELIEYLLQNGADPFMEENYMRDDPRITTYNAYEYAKYDIKDEAVVALLDKYNQS